MNAVPVIALGCVGACMHACTCVCLCVRAVHAHSFVLSRLVNVEFKVYLLCFGILILFSYIDEVEFHFFPEHFLSLSMIYDHTT